MSDVCIVSYRKQSSISRLSTKKNFVSEKVMETNNMT